MSAEARDFWVDEVAPMVGLRRSSVTEALAVESSARRRRLSRALDRRAQEGRRMEPGESARLLLASLVLFGPEPSHGRRREDREGGR